MLTKCLIKGGVGATTLFTNCLMKVGIHFVSGPSESSLKELDNVTGATVDRMDYREQTISVSGCQRALNKLGDTLQLIVQGNFGIV